ncbi:MAG: GNAT family N-acetyltransferase [Erythrobacter sp.]
MSENESTVQIAPSVGSFDQDEWNALGGDQNPFVSHEFLSALEDSRSVGEGTGWDPAPISIIDASGKLIGAMPSYVKTHNRGEYVFDHAWAEAYERAGGRYFPKLQIAAPFTPANGPRLLCSSVEVEAQLIQSVELVCQQSGISSAHATFVDSGQIESFENAGWLMRSDIQFHWQNRGYASFDEFLGDLASRKRKNMRRERLAAQENLTIERFSGDQIRPEHWDAFWIFYQDTGSRKWGAPYLTREAFTLLGERMADRIVLVLAFADGLPIAGALNFVGQDALFGRYWGCVRDVRFLHFELCYYQAIDIAIERGLTRVEAGAQGSHKLARGYEPEKTWSAHWIADSAFRSAVADFLERERAGVSLEQTYLDARMPFKKG